MAAGDRRVTQVVTRVLGATPSVERITQYVVRVLGTYNPCTDVACPEWVAETLERRGHRNARLWEIERSDGDTLYLTDHCGALEYEGNDYTPVGGPAASAAEHESGEKEHTRELTGAIVLGGFEISELEANLWDDAAVIERVVDWRYPWAGCKKHGRWYLRNIQWDGERWTAQLAGITSRFQRPRGDFYSHDCTRDLGDEFGTTNPGCKFDVAATSETGTVSAVIVGQRRFRATGLTPAHIAEYFVNGTLTWAAGANVGKTAVVKEATEGAGYYEIELELSESEAIQIGDTFDLVQGCQKRFIEDCQPKAMATHFGGDPYMPNDLGLSLQIGAPESPKGTWTTVLGLTGAVIGLFTPLGPLIGAAIGTFLGAMIDGNNLDAPTVEEIKQQGSSEGDPMQRFIGREPRLAGQIMWRGPFDSFTNEHKGETHAWLPLAVSFGHSFKGTASKKLVKLFANDKLIYEDRDELSLTGTDISADAVSKTDFDPATGTTVTTQTYLDLISISTDLSGISAGGLLTVGGYSGGGAVNNGTWMVVSTSQNKVRCRDMNIATYAFADAAAGPTVSLFQAAKQYSFYPLTDFTVYLGSADQQPDPTMEALEGSGNVPGYTGRFYIVYSRFGVDWWGYAVPRFEAIIRERDSADLAEVLKDLAVGHGIDQCEIDTGDAVGLFRGYAARGPKSLAGLLSPILMAYNLVTQERDLKLRIFPRLAADVKTIDEVDLGAKEDQPFDATVSFLVDREDSKRLPAQVSLTFLNVDTSGENGSATHRRSGLPLENVIALSLPLVLDSEQAKKIAKRILWSEAVTSERHELPLPPSRLLTYESDVLQTTHKGRSRATMVTRAVEGNNYVMEVFGQKHDPYIYTNESGTAGEVFPPNLLPVEQGHPQMRLADIGPLADDDALVTLLYYGVVREGLQYTWNGVTVHESSNGGASYNELADVTGESQAGVTAAALGSGPVGWWDDANTLTVDFTGGQIPTSLTDEELLNGVGNWYYVNGEIVGVRTWALVSAELNRWAGTRLLRGLMDTADRVAGHGAAETVARVRPVGALARRIYAEALIGQSRLYKAAPFLANPTDYPSSSATLHGNTKRPFSPSQATGTRHTPATNDWTVAFIPCTRLPLTAIFGPTVPSLAETTEAYEVEVYEATFTTLKRAITGTASANGSVVTTATPLLPSVKYDEQDQVADFGSAQATIYLRIRQVGSTGLKSKPYQVTIS